jgi:hypothetical protein
VSSAASTPTESKGFYPNTMSSTSACDSPLEGIFARIIHDVEEDSFAIAGSEGH